METGDAGEGSLIGGGVGEIQDALNAERDGLRQAHVPVEMRAGETPPGALGGIEAGLIDVDPEVGTSPDLREGTVYARRVAIGPQGGVVKQGNPNGVAVSIAVPGGGVQGGEGRPAPQPGG